MRARKGRETSLLAPKTTRNRATLAYEEIARLIEQKKLAGGEVLVEQSLAAYLGISRTPVRQALQRLEIEGQLVKANTKSFVVRKVDLKEYLQSLKAREIIESEACAMCAGHAAADRLAVAKSMTAALKGDQAYNPEQHWAADKVVHDLVTDFCGNQVVAGIIRSLRVTTKLFEVDRLAERLEPDIRQHEAILDRIEKGDGEGAKQAMAAHLRSLVQFAVDRIT
ncbi:GntR family transcriptional regulator [Martelella radicis]|uniref:DNA-binding GntR family transcriptional regulator n=1 Tax=Martelella radicis TaxID=1397476 RepID=A0A7W6PAH2_9HYPH|nr:GntR family transcriptional regulator [Martelella radicis]MBB4123337.1 DNA-binding GntR family transcriptional regulator [Martelella radicis]